jgi:hypothetical protein
MRQIEVADALWAQVPTDLLEDAGDHAERAVCAVCRLPIEIGASPVSMLAYIEPEGPISLALAHRDCSDSRVIAAIAKDHPAESIDTFVAMRWRAHLRSRRPGAMLLWDNLDSEADGPGAILGRVLEALGFVAPVGPTDLMAPPRVGAVRAALQGNDLSLVLADPDISEPELQSFPDVTGGPWIEQARLDRAIVVVYGHLQLGRSEIGLVDIAADAGELIAAVVAFRD